MAWFSAYEKLRQFAEMHPRIQICQGLTVIPEDVRHEFYGLFDEVRRAILRELLPFFKQEAGELAYQYEKVEEEVKRSLNLYQILISTRVRRFLKNPEDEVIGNVFDSLFALLKGQRDRETFWREVSYRVQNTYTELYHRVYSQWVVLSLVKLSKATGCFSVPVPSIEITSRGPKIETDPKPIPHPQRSRTLSFLGGTTPAFIVPDFIVYSPGRKRFFAFRTGIENLEIFREVLWRAISLSNERKWIRVRDLIPLWGKYYAFRIEEIVCIYAHHSAENLALVADADSFCQPETVLFVVRPQDSLEMALEKGKILNKLLAPATGVFVICSSGGTQAFREKIEKDISFLSIGFNEKNLTFILDLLG